MAHLMTGIDLSRTGGLAVYLDDGADAGLMETSAAGGTYCHTDISSVVSGYTALDAALLAGFQGVLTTNAANLSVDFDSSTFYTVAISGGPNLSLDFRDDATPNGVGSGSDAGKRLAAALGFDYTHSAATGGSASNPYDIKLSGQPEYISNVAPYYYLALARDGVSRYSRDFEVGGQIKRGMTASGTPYGIGPRTFEKRTRFGLRFQSLASVFPDQAAASARWTFWDLLEHARVWEPVLLSYTSEDLVINLVDAEFTENARRPVWPNYHEKWDLEVLGQVRGLL